MTRKRAKHRSVHKALLIVVFIFPQPGYSLRVNLVEIWLRNIGYGFVDIHQDASASQHVTNYQHNTALFQENTHMMSA
jgi:hypothetical protein